jgi:predicted dehydrogenase
VDLLRYLTGQPIVGADIVTLGGPGPAREENVAISLKFADGSLGTIHYVATGHRAFPKERVEVFCAGRVLQLDNFRRLRGYGWPGLSTVSLWRQDKGQRALVQAFVDAIRTGGEAPIPVEELIEVSRIVITLGKAARG